MPRAPGASSRPSDASPATARDARVGTGATAQQEVPTWPPLVLALCRLTRVHRAALSFVPFEKGVKLRNEVEPKPAMQIVDPFFGYTS